MKTTKWACPSTIAKLGIDNDFNLLCANAGLQHFVYQGYATYRRLTLEFLSTRTHNVGLNPKEEEECRSLSISWIKISTSLLRSGVTFLASPTTMMMMFAMSMTTSNRIQVEFV